MNKENVSLSIVDTQIEIIDTYNSIQIGIKNVGTYARYIPTSIICPLKERLICYLTPYYIRY